MQVLEKNDKGYAGQQQKEVLGVHDQGYRRKTIETYNKCMILNEWEADCVMKSKNMKVIPLSLKQANDFVEKYHRHHNPVVGHKFSIGAVDDNKHLVGIAIVGRPVSRYLDNGKTLEVTRLCTDGTYNVCSFLYSRCARIAKDMGYEKIITYILESESGASLKASGWELEQGKAGGGSWNVPSRPRELEPTQLSLFPQKPKYPTENKKRWCKFLNK